LLSPALYNHPPLYDRVVQAGPCEAFYREVARNTGGPVLELACGTGRLTLPVARDGHDTTGLDASPLMLAAARSKTEEDLSVTFVTGDMQAFDLGRRFGLVLVSCNSLAHLATNEALRDCFACVRRHLAPGGVFAFDIVNPNVETLARPADQPVRLDTGPNPSTAVQIEEVAFYDPVRQLRTSCWRVLEPGQPGHDLAPLTLRQIFPQELLLLLEASGLELAARFGDFEHNPLEAWSLNQVCLVRACPGQRAMRRRAS
jgi:SAM-dependent methyltransferase